MSINNGVFLDSKFVSLNSLSFTTSLFPSLPVCRKSQEVSPASVGLFDILLCRQSWSGGDKIVGETACFGSKSS